MKNKDPKWLRGEVLDLRNLLIEKNEKIAELERLIEYLKKTNALIGNELKKLREPKQAKPDKSWYGKILGCEFSLEIWKEKK